MTRILEEGDVTLASIASVLEEAGLDPTPLDATMISVETQGGLKVCITLFDDRKFLMLGSALPLREDLEDRLELVNRMNSEVFFPAFSVDSDGDITVDHCVSYAHGLIVAQFLGTVGRYSEVLEDVVRAFEHEEVFDFDALQGAARPESRLLQ